MTNRLINLAAFIILSILWLAFGIGLVLNPAALDAVWQMFVGAPLLLQGAIALLTLPIVAGLWIWETSWPVLLRLALVLGLAWVTEYTFFPRMTTGPRKGQARQAQVQ